MGTGNMRKVRDTVKEIFFAVKAVQGISTEMKPYYDPCKKWKWWKNFTHGLEPEKYIEQIIKGLEEKMPRIKIEGLTEDERTAFNTIWIELVRIFCKEQTILVGAPGTKGEDGNSRNPNTEVKRMRFTINARRYKVIENVSYRDAPDGEILRYGLKRGEIVDALEIKGNWVQVAHERWVPIIDR